MASGLFVQVTVAPESTIQLIGTVWCLGVGMEYCNITAIARCYFLLALVVADREGEALSLSPASESEVGGE